MRSNAVGVLAALMLVSPALLTDAEAQRHGIGGGASAVPHISAPAPHFSAPAPHMPGLRFSAPQVTAPPPAAPHFHMSAPLSLRRRFGFRHRTLQVPTILHRTSRRDLPRSIDLPRPRAIASPAPLPGKLDRIAQARSRDTTLAQRYHRFQARQDV